MQPTVVAWCRAGFTVCLIAGAVLGPVGASATPPLQKQARAQGFAATDCSYCHTFDMEHMRKKGREAGIPNMNCVNCHGKTLPRTGRGLLNERGQWLLDERIRRKVKAVDAAWLREYPRKEAKPPS